MKKFLFILLLFTSFSVFARNPVSSCEIRESKIGNVASLAQTNVKSDGQPSVSTLVRLTKVESVDVTIVVEAWEGNEHVGTTTVTIKAGQKSAIASLTGYDGIKLNKNYTLTIAKVSCQ